MNETAVNVTFRASSESEEMRGNAFEGSISTVGEPGRCSACLADVFPHDPLFVTAETVGRLLGENALCVAWLMGLSKVLTRCYPLQF